MPPERTTTSYAILGLLALRTWTTYELAKQVRRSLRWFWPAAERTLYDEPKRLAAAGLVTATTEHTGKRPRTVYDITESGRSELARWLGEPAAPRGGDFEGMVKVFFADSGSVEQLEETLEAIETDTAARVAALADMAETGDRTEFPERLHISALALPLQLEQEAAVLRWARWARVQVRSWESTRDGGDWDAEAVLRKLATDARRL